MVFLYIMNCTYLSSFPLQMVEGSPDDPYKFYPPKTPKMNEVTIILPQGVVCDRCVLQWIYKAGKKYMLNIVADP